MGALPWTNHTIVPKGHIAVVADYILRENECYGKSKSSSCQRHEIREGKRTKLTTIKEAFGGKPACWRYSDARAQPLYEKKRLELNRDRTRTKLIDARFETDGRWSFTIGIPATSCREFSKTPDDLRFMKWVECVLWCAEVLLVLGAGRATNRKTSFAFRKERSYTRWNRINEKWLSKVNCYSLLGKKSAS